MPANTGRKPRLERCDIKLNNGMVIRDVDPAEWRWAPDEFSPSPGDIAVYQPAGALREWKAGRQANGDYE